MIDPVTVVDPEVPIVDPHHHFWVGAAGHYMLEELLEDVGSGHNIDATVYIECGSFYRAGGPEELRSVGEVEFANGMAALAASGQYGPTRFCASIVGFADLRLAERVDSVLDALIAAGNGRLKGIRHMAANDPQVKELAPAGMLLDPGFQAGYARLAEYGLSFDAWLYHPQLEELYTVAAKNPGVPVIINHAAGLIGMGSYANQRDASFNAWRTGLQALASLPHVSMKLGGFFMPVFGLSSAGAQWRDHTELAAAAAPIIETCIETFGPERCMFESNFPVNRDATSYRTIWNAYKTSIAAYSPTERALLLHHTAQRTYDIPPRTTVP